MAVSKIYFRYYLLLIFLIPGEALWAQKTALTRTPGMVYLRAINLYEQQNYGAAEALFDKYIRLPGIQKNLLTENASFYAAESSVKLGENDALYRLTRFSDQYPSSAWLPTVNFSMGNLYFQMGRYSLVMDIFNKVDPKFLNKKQQAQYFFEKGFCLLKRHKLTNALPLFQRVMTTDSPFAQTASYYYAYIKYQMGNYEDALKGFLAVKDNPRYKRFVPDYLLYIYYKQKRFNKVVELGKYFLKSAGYKSRVELNHLMANAYYQMNDFNQALPYFREYEKNTRHKISREEEYRIGYTRFKTEHYAEAVYNFQQVTLGQGLLAQNAWFHLGYCYVKTARPHFAQNAFVSAYKLKQDPRLTAEALFAYLKLTLQEKSGSYNDAIALTEDFLRNNSSTFSLKREASKLLVQLYLNTNNKLAAIASIEKRQHPDHILQSAFQQLTYRQAVELYQSGQYVAALRYFTKALKYSPNPSLKLKSLYWTADTYYQLRKFPQAAWAYKTFLTSRGATTFPLFPLAYYDLAYSYFNQKKYPQAIEFFNRFLYRKPGDRNMVNDARLRIADSYVVMNNYSMALARYNEVIKQSGSNTDYALYQKAYCYGAQGEFKKKVNTLLALVTDYRNSAYYNNALYDIASTYASALNEPREAIVYFQKLVNESPHSTYGRKALVKMGLLYYKNNQNVRAISVLKQVISLYPATSEAKIALNALESIYKGMGNLTNYFAYAKKLNFVQISKSKEDSLSFSMGADAYLAGNCQEVISYLTSYLQKFPRGGFVLKAYHYLAHCYARQQDTLQALNFYDKIISFPENDFTIQALTMAARMRYAMKSYPRAFLDYKRLAIFTKDPSLKLEAIDGSMRSAFLLGNYAVAEKAAKQLLMTPKVVSNQIVFAHYVLAKSALNLGEPAKAIYEFKITDQLSKGPLGAEAKYNLALLAFHGKNYKKAQKLIFALSDEYPNEVYWVAKGFILLADTYTAQGNIFQARETLKSVLNNYPGEGLKKVARQKLSQLPNGQAIKVKK